MVREAINHLRKYHGDGKRVTDIVTFPVRGNANISRVRQQSSYQSRRGRYSEIRSVIDRSKLETL